MEKNDLNLRSDEIQELDVLSGRVGKSNHHYGNKVFRHLIATIKPTYQSISTAAPKGFLSESIVEKLLNMGGRFLIHTKRDIEPQWRIMSKAESRRKTRHALQERQQVD